MIRYEQKVSATRPSRSGEQGPRFPLARLVAFYRICHLHEPDYLAVSYQAEVYVAGRLLVIVDFSIVINSSPQKLQIDNVLKSPAELFFRPEYARKVRDECGVRNLQLFVADSLGGLCRILPHQKHKIRLRKIADVRLHRMGARNP